MIKEELMEMLLTEKTYEALVRKKDIYLIKGYFRNLNLDRDNSKSVMRNIYRIMELGKRWVGVSKARNQSRDSFSDIIEPLSKVEIRILRLRYLDARPWEEIAELVNYSRAQVFRIHDRAIEKLEKAYRVEEFIRYG